MRPTPRRFRPSDRAAYPTVTKASSQPAAEPPRVPVPLPTPPVDAGSPGQPLRQGERPDRKDLVRRLWRLPPDSLLPGHTSRASGKVRTHLLTEWPTGKGPPEWLPATDAHNDSLTN